MTPYNMSENDRWSRYIELRDKVLDHRLDDAGLIEFEQIIFADDEAKRDFVERLHQESALLNRGDLDFDATSIPFDLATLEKASRHSPLTSNLSRRFVAVLAGSVLLLGTLSVAYLIQQKQSFLAMMGSTENCQWGASDMSTMPGARLSRGRLVLLSGIATLKFPLVDVTLEGPVDVELVSTESCRVHSGRIFAEVHPGGEGFIVETPTATLTDRGTVFGVNVAPGGTSDVSVLQGLVDVKHLATGEVISVKTNSAMRMSALTVERLHEPSESTASVSDTKPDEIKYRSIQITTAVGNGRDAYVIAGQERPTTQSSGVILVKESLEERGAWRRRAYLHFDLSLLPQVNIHTAKLQLQGAATGIGYLAATPNTTFAVYGLTDESHEAWDEDSLDWESCPGILSNRVNVNPSHVILLGRFVVPSSETTTLFSIEGEQLVKFLLSDTNGGATLMIVSETVGKGSSYVHGFASKQHPSLSPPTLRLGVSGNDAPH